MLSIVTIPPDYTILSYIECTGEIPFTSKYTLVNQDQIKLAMALLQSMQDDPVAQADANIYGNWYEHLADQLSDIEIGV